jgi:glycosyltransferase involved in cell wall biosynthesis
MRIALFTDTYLPDVNGVAKTLGRYIDYMKAQGIDCKVFAPDLIEPEKVREQHSFVERFYSIPFLLYPECRMAIPNPVHIKRALHDFQPTLVHSATPFNMGLYGLHYAKKHHIPFVASYHTHFDQYLSFYKMQWMEPMLWKYLTWFHRDCSKIFVPSRSTLTHLSKKGFKALEIWGRGIETSKFTPHVNRSAVLQRNGLDPDRFSLLFVGRLAPEKSIDVLMKTFDSLAPDIKLKSQLIIVGDGPLYKEVQEQTRHLPEIQLLGFRQGQELYDLYAASDVFLFPSQTETFGNVVLEAMAAGTPIIGANSGGVGDNVIHLKTGLLCPPGDVSAFTDAVERLYRDESLRRLMALEARQYSLNQSWDRIFAKLTEHLREAEAPANVLVSQL